MARQNFYNLYFNQYKTLLNQTLAYLASQLEDENFWQKGKLIRITLNVSLYASNINRRSIQAV
ncbi:MAG: hypothetical protein PUP93_14615 [Rhizonema sp. NSF051]|nr:hypothetical protein [Rhizonema sp. NSF051]